ncbi:TPA: hypothetical protein DEG21_01980 [Patescibacteria group bacterium]|nr:hypothetical protein [Candidatus Gracilibacteria bacterium]
MRSETSKDTFFWINYSNFKSIISKVIKRSPLSIIILLALFLLLLINLNAQNLSSYTHNIIVRSIFSLIITFFLSV